MEVHNEFKHLRIRFKDIQFATNNFNTFSKKYKGIDSYNNDTYKAELKCVDREYLTSIDLKKNDELPKRRYIVKITYIKFPKKEVYKAVEVLLNCKHHNVESILGYCMKYGDMILVHEYFSTEKLSTCLIYKTLTWDTRLKVCLDIAHGLNYLHHDMEGGKAVYHCNIDSYIIQLNTDWEAKITDFRSSIYLHPNREDDALYLNAPYLPNPNSYTDAEYSENIKLKKESDLYKFGVIMLEMLCGLSKKGLDELVRGWLDEGTIYSNVDYALRGENSENIFLLNKGPNKDSLDTFINIASHCVAVEKSQRPTLKVIIKELKDALSFQENNKDILRMSLEEIKLATQDFNRVNDIGGGGFGRVYKGRVAEKGGNGEYAIVAKKLDTKHGQGEKQFYNELQILYEYKHKNIIGLVGYSNETYEKIIVYEHAHKGSLDKYLSDTSLTWKNRLNICIDFVSGLDFLHGGGHGQEIVIHRDIKAANILLFDNWKAKVGDFGLSMISTVNKETHYVIDHACGTKGYLDPLYLKTGFLTLESDIYSLGVVLFEILCGSTTFEIYKLKGQYLPCFIKDIFKEGKQSEVVFHAIKYEIVQKSLTTFQNIAYQCLDDDREKRPTSKVVLAQLKNAMELQVSYKSL
uniref:probable serine/threonine-protein kinase PBL23 n=1 Tax=Erigeron canadensis TaxID=72917 RepID=UPI001CB98F24|nr:probable serine/threonine-protein kinase PBL23 [Erigeron canadensis]